MRLTLVLILLLISFPVFAQFGSVAEPITAANIHRLQSVAQINFADLDADFDSGWFDMSSNGNVYVGLTAKQEAYVFPGSLHFNFDTSSGEPILGFEGYLLEQTDMSASGISVESAPADLFFGQLLFRDGSNYVYQRMNQSDTERVDRFRVPIDGIPVAIWSDCERTLDVLLACSTWVEMRRDQETWIVEFPATPGAAAEPIIHPYAPAQDPDAIVRIGRIPPPYTVTSSRDGLVKLWNIETGAVLYQVDNGTGEAAVFGAINTDATHLVWRDNLNETLYLLDFATGENRQIASLDGHYVQWYFLSRDTSVVIGVNYGDEPVLIAWDTLTGERTVLGAYRACSRPQPDMARLSADGMTLVIGCDTGLDIWRVVPENE